MEKLVCIRLTSEFQGVPQGTMMRVGRTMAQTGVDAGVAVFTTKGAFGVRKLDTLYPQKLNHRIISARGRRINKFGPKMSAE